MTAAWTTLRNGQSALPENLKAWLFGTARNILSLHFKDKSARGEVLMFEPDAYDVEDPKVFNDFREIEYKQGLPRFLELVNDAIESMPAKYRNVIRINVRDGSTGKALAAQVGVTPAEASRLLNEARPKLAQTASTLLMARTCREACPKFDSYLQGAEWAGGPFSDELRQRLMQHVSSCPTCKSTRSREMKWIGILPAVAPVLVAPELYQRIMKVAFETQDMSLSSASRDSNQHSAPNASEPPANILGGSGDITDSSANDNGGNDNSHRHRKRALLSLLLFLTLLGINAYNGNATLTQDDLPLAHTQTELPSPTSKPSPTPELPSPTPELPSPTPESTVDYGGCNCGNGSTPPLR
jgi:DNA-directed RNA polymerase specialized sigma24 family protein